MAEDEHVADGAGDPVAPAEPVGSVDPLEQLPPAVRARVLALAAQVLPSVPSVPAPLRKVASFAPARRARLGAGPLAAALADDADFRAHVATRVEAVVPPDAGDADRAATLWLRGTDTESLTAVLDRLDADPPTDPRAEAEQDRLRRRVEDLQRDLRAEKERQRDQLARIKAENADLRRKLGEARTALRTAQTELDEAVGRAHEATRDRARLEGDRDAEVRRLRAQAAELQAALDRSRGEARGSREDATLRARLLLDTVLDAAAGLRRELALPAAQGSPAARVEDELAARHGSRDPGAAGVLGADSPALLDQLLAMPRARLVVDGYNVSRTAWDTSSLEAQRARLLRALAPLVARTGAETTVVFDAANAGPRPVVAAPRGVRVLFSPAGVLADDVIRELVAAEPPGRPVVVVTSDREVATDVVRAGFRAVGSPALLGLVGG